MQPSNLAFKGHETILGRRGRPPESMVWSGRFLANGHIRFCMMATPTPWRAMRRLSRNLEPDFRTIRISTTEAMPNRMYPPMAAVGAQPHHLVSRSPSVCPSNIFGVLDRWRCYSRAGGRARCRCASGRCCTTANRSIATFFHHCNTCAQPTDTISFMLLYKCRPFLFTCSSDAPKLCVCGA